MEPLQKEYQRLWKRTQSSKTISDVQATINLLQEARDTIANNPNSASITLAKLQNPVKASFDATNDSLKEAHSGLNKYTKALDRLFKDKPLPSTEYDALSSHPTLVNRAIAMHLLREGQFSVAATFLSEVAKNPTPTQTANEDRSPEDDAAASVLDMDQLQSREIQRQFKLMYHILHELKQECNLLPAIEWAATNRERLEARGSNLEFELCRLQFVWLFHGGNNPSVPMVVGRQMALDYAKREFTVFQKRHLKELQQLLGAMAFAPNLEDSPYSAIFNNPSAWSEVANSFTREFCSLLGLSADSPLYIAATAGTIALPTLLKLKSIMKAKRTEWTSENELPVEIPLPPSYQFHSIFVCPVSKEQSTDENPPMMMPCRHVICQESLMRLSKGGKFKCPYCPNESHPRDAQKVFL
ncbi:hypothetical protein AJ80_06523 [Polytolypa hystricis UAMH7299]|uniref:GID complex catalytic subunit 2 n=1 Tax=Polytolypa hystricis (strain UAMH7299) TaxID=1447883 RepID=A0A2B7XWI7_POLH7|nr:hypothetical protein AJ80_06523 [Polytolypa hystricis UAMH7299]